MGLDLEAIKSRIRTGWSQGDYTPIGEILRPAAEALVDACAVSAGQEVLDVGAGTGNFARLAAREGARVVALDLTPPLIEQGRAAAESEGLEIEWVEGDVEQLPFEDASFDCVGSNFGAMFAPRPEVAGAELLRVLRPGGVAGMTTWVRGGYTDRLFSMIWEYGPPREEGLPEGVEWAEAENARNRLAGASRVTVEERMLPIELPSAERYWEILSTNGPLKLVVERLPEDRREELRGRVLEVVRESSATEDAVRIDTEYALIVARKAG